MIFFKLKNRKMLKTALSFMTVLFVIFDFAFCLPCKADETSIWPVGPSVSAKSAIVIEANTGLVLYKKDIYNSYQPANLTQLMTCLLTVEKNNLNEVMTMSTAAETKTSGSRVGLVRREQVTLESALYAVMLASGNEVAYGLSEHVGTTRDHFVEMMNSRAKQLGCTNTNFASPEGADSTDNYSCAYDLALIAKEVFANTELLAISGSSAYSIPATNLNVARPISNKHQFIKKKTEYEPAKAGKYAYSSQAGYCSATLLEKDGMKIIVLVLNDSSADNMYKDIKTLGNWCFENFTVYNIKENELGGNAAFASLFNQAQRFEVASHSEILSFDSESCIVVPKGVAFKEVTRTVTMAENKEFYHGENKLGVISYSYGGIFVGSTDIIYYNEGYPLNTETIKQQWPPFLFTIEEAFSEKHKDVLQEYLSYGYISPTPTEAPAFTPSPTPSPTPGQEVVDYQSVSSFKKRMIIGGGSFVALIFIVLYIVAFEIPYRKKNKDW